MTLFHPAVAGFANAYKFIHSRTVCFAGVTEKSIPTHSESCWDDIYPLNQAEQTCHSWLKQKQQGARSTPKTLIINYIFL